jgi:hypothetical protein
MEKKEIDLVAGSIIHLREGDLEKIAGEVWWTGLQRRRRENSTED